MAILVDFLIAQDDPGKAEEAEELARAAFARTGPELAGGTLHHRTWHIFHTLVKILEMRGKLGGVESLRCRFLETLQSELFNGASNIVDIREGEAFELVTLLMKRGKVDVAKEVMARYIGRSVDSDSGDDNSDSGNDVTDVSDGADEADGDGADR